MPRILVSLVSAQTIPNLQLILHYSDRIDKYLFISTIAMEKQSRRQWIIDAAQIPETSLLPPVIVNHNSYQDIMTQLGDIEIDDDYDEFVVNVTGGNKLMAIACMDFFKQVKSEIYYLTGSNKECQKLFPGRLASVKTLQTDIDLHQFLRAHGFDEIKPGNLMHDLPQAQRLLSLFSQGLTDAQHSAVEFCRQNRGTTKLPIDLPAELVELLRLIQYPHSSDKRLTKYDARYLSGEWFEEYVYHRLTDEAGIPSSHIGTGYTLRKGNDPSNEFDVLFTYQDHLFSIECKTSVLDKDAEDKVHNILSSTYYKSDSLKKKFGLFPKVYIATLDRLFDETDQVLPKMKSHYERATKGGITVLGRREFQSEKSISELLNLHPS